MTIDMIHGLVHAALAVVLATDGDGWLLLLAAGPASAFATYWAIYRYYRNTDKSHEFERDTIIHAQPVQGSEEKVDHISRTRDKDIDGDNSDKYRQRVQRIR